MVREFSDAPPSRRAVLAGIGAGAALGLMPVSARADLAVMNWGSSALGSSGFHVINLLAGMVSKHTDYRSAALATAGPRENMYLIREGVLDFAQTLSTDWKSALAGSGRFSGDGVRAFQMFGFSAWNCSPVVRADSDIGSLEDLKGKVVMPGPRSGPAAQMWFEILTAAGLVRDIRWRFGTWRETFDAMGSGHADCVPSLLTDGEPSPLMRRLNTLVETRFLDIPDALLAEAQASNPGILSIDFTRNAAPGTPARPLLSFTAILAAAPIVSEEIGYEATRAIFGNLPELKAWGGARVARIDLESAVGMLIPEFPVHPGAASYFREQGVWREELRIGRL